ncbi:MAG: PQQ-dependent sugar dehydrogenase [Mucilaginibacter sp.]|nr:PQQ-dependent sugar dehydrogenase [Mucilaginibacter sp.]
MKTLKWLIAVCFITIILSAFIVAKKVKIDIALADTTGFKIDTLAHDLVVPWQLVFLPDNSLLFTERNGKLRIYKNGKLVDKPAFVIPNIPQRNKTG